MTKWTDSEIQFLKDSYQLYSAKDIAQMLNRDHGTTKRQIKKHIFDVNDATLLNGFVIVERSPIHAVNKEGVVIRIKTRKILVQTIDKNGYPCVCLQNAKTERVHRIVAETFLNNPDKKPQVNHIDGSKTNNSVDNLEWVTNDENRLHAIKTGLWSSIGAKVSKLQTGETNSSAKLKETHVLEIYSRLKNGESVVSIAKHYKVNHANICAIKTGKSWKHLYHNFTECSKTS